MAATSVPIGLVTLPIGTTVVGPVQIVQTIHGMRLTIDKTITNGFNATPTTSVTTSFEKGPSNTGPWSPMGSSVHPGGPIEGEHGATETVLVDDNTFDPPLTSGWVRYVVTVTGHTVAVGGTAQDKVVVS